MGYRAHKEGIKTILQKQGYIESPQVFDFKEDSDTGLNRRFLFERTDVEFSGDGVEFLIDIVRPINRYQIKIGFKLSPSAPRSDYDVSQQQLDVLISCLCNPVNYSSFCIKLQPIKISTVQVEDHIETVMAVEILDNITLT